MQKNYLKIALRNLVKHRAYTFINVAGLAVGMACFILILLYVQDELSFDRYHEKAEQIYRVALHGQLAGNEIHTTNTCAPMAAALVAEYPEVLHATRIFPYNNRATINRGDKRFAEDRIYYADSTYFNVFSLELLSGNPKTALVAPYSVVITEEMAEKYFGDEDPIGQTLAFNFGQDANDYHVTGVCKKIPANSHFRFDFLASLSSLGMAKNPMWINNSFMTYLVLQKGIPPEQFEAKFPGLIRKYVAPQIQQALGMSFDDLLANGGRYEYTLQRLTDIHLHSNLQGELEANGNAAYVTVFLLIAIFILVLACINFMNLATARSANRAKEVGIRKSVGSYKSQLVWQFLIESVLMSSIAIIFALILVYAFLPFFNDLAAKQIEIGYLENALFLPMLIGITLFVGISAGIYPAFFLSSFQPVEVLKGQIKSGIKSGKFRSALVVFQFVISITLIIGTLVIGSQLQYIRDKDLGFNKEHIVVIPRADALGSRLSSVEHDLESLPDVLLTSATQHMPGKEPYGNVYFAQDAPSKEGYILSDMYIGYDFIETLGMEVVAGRSFSREFGADSTAHIINQAAMEKFGWKDAIGKILKQPGPEGQNNAGPVIGVLKNFHFRSLHDVITPAVLHIRRNPDHLLVKMKPDNIKQTLSNIENVWSKHAPDQPFEYTFYDEDFDQLYRADQRVGSLFETFSFLGIFIACLGLFGLASFATEQRTKEIGVRKVLGASVPNIVMLLSKEFTKLVALAFLFAIPAAYFGMNYWLQNFAYRNEISIFSFLFAGVLAIVIAWLTVSYQSIKASLANPVQALKYE